MNNKNEQAHDGNQPSALNKVETENAKYVSDAEMVQQVINSYYGKGPKLAFSLYNKVYDGKSRIRCDYMAYKDMTLDVNALQLKKLIEYSLTGEATQVFPLTDDDLANASEEDLLPVVNIRESVLTDLISKAYRRIKVLNAFSDAEHLCVHANLKGALITFWINRDSEVAKLMRQKHLIL